jgi:hypothetical protein
VFTVVTHLPVFSSGHNTRLVIVYVLCLALLAGWGLDDLTDRALPAARRAILGAAAVLLAIPIVAVAAGVASLDQAPGALKVAAGVADPPWPLDGHPEAIDVVRWASLYVWLLFGGAALALLALRLASARRAIAPAALGAALQAVAELPGQAGELLARPTPYARLADELHKKSDFLYLGRGIQFPIALEGALKLKEISYIHAEGYPAGEMKHGPIALIDAEMPVVAIAPRDRVYDKLVNNVEQVKARGGVVVAVAEDGDEQIAATADHVIHVPPTWSHVAPILTTIPLQLLAYHVAVRRGCDVDQPRNLAKSVTVE